MNRKVIPFHIAIGAYISGDSYPVRAMFQDATVMTSLQLPEQLLDATADLLELGELALDDADTFGRQLGRALFTPQLRDLLLQSVKSASQAGARLQLQLQIAPPELALLPWEMLTVGMARAWSPALRDDYALLRVSRGAQPPAPAIVAGPLQVLAVAAPGEDIQLDALEVALAEELRTGWIELRLLRDATPDSFERALMSAPVHVVHISAPVAMASGSRRRAAPRLLLRRGIEGFDLAEMLAGTADLRLATLTGPQGDARELRVTLPALAGLLSAELPATLAFGGPLPARLSARFAAACYAALARGMPVDLAASAGRRALAEGSPGRHPNAGGWGMIQLRLAPGAEQLFSFRRGIRARRLGLPRLALLAAAILVLAAALLGARMLGLRFPTATSAQSLPSASALPSQVSTAVPTDVDVSTPAPTSPGLLRTLFGDPATPTSTPMPTGIPTPNSYATFMTGVDDTLQGIAERMGSTADAIAILNHLDPNAPLRANRPLVIPVYQAGASGAGGLVVPRGNPAEPKVALTFDIEIDQATLYSILDILRARGLHATFFTTGHWVMAFPDAARAIVAQGHEIGNHSLTHPYFSRIGLNGAASELSETERIIQQTTGVTSRPYFRFPYGDSTPDTAAVVARSGYVAYHWSADDPAIPAWLDRVARNPAEGNGGILLMHGRPETVAALPGYLDRLAALGLQPTTLGDALR